MADDFPIILFETEQDWISWLEKNGDQPGLWVRIAKKKSGLQSITYQQALDIAICFGWIDGLKKRYDEKTFIQRFTHRRPKSNWSKINRDKAERLIAEGKMRAAGLEEIEKAKKSGAWENAYDSQSNAKVPEDLRIALKENPSALAFFESLDKINRYAILYRIQITKTKEARTKKILYFVEMLYQMNFRMIEKNLFYFFLVRVCL